MVVENVVVLVVVSVKLVVMFVRVERLSTMFVDILCPAPTPLPNFVSSAANEPGKLDVVVEKFAYVESDISELLLFMLSST